MVGEHAGRAENVAGGGADLVDEGVAVVWLLIAWRIPVGLLAGFYGVYVGIFG